MNLSPVPKLPDEESKSIWISNVEIDTYEAPKTHIWMTGQFKFKTFENTSLYSNYEYNSKPIDLQEDAIMALGKSVMINHAEPRPLDPKQKIEASTPAPVPSTFRYISNII